MARGEGSMNPTLIFAVVLLWGGSLGGMYLYGRTDGRALERDRQAAVADAVRATRQAAQEGAADAISKIKITNTTIRAATETIIRDNVRYVDCRHAPGMYDAINEALTGRAKSPGSGELPGVNPVN